MEKWELQIQGFPAAPDPRRLTKALQTAGAVLKTDLADFETERIFETLLQSPVDLLKTILAQHPEETWSNAITEAFKLIGSVAKKYQAVLDPYFENIVKICQLPHLPHVRRQALVCLSELARVTPQAATSARRFATELETSNTCRTELALLVGTLCEYHPEVLENQVARIWRTYLSFLSCSGLTDKFISSVLEGASGLLASFGRNLPVVELWEFYDSMARLHHRCRNACIKILRHHSALFKERIADDANTRAILWAVATQNGVVDALTGVYGAVAEVKGDGVKTIIQQEVIPQLSTNKLQALTVLSNLRGNGFDSDLECYVDAQKLEFELRCEGVSYYTADLIIWYIRSGLADSCRLAQSACLFYRNLPASKVSDLAAAILSNSDVREETITFLASECSQPSVEHTEYMLLWQALLVDGPSGVDRDAAFEDYMRYLEVVLECWLEEDKETLPEKLSSLLRLTTNILSLSHEDLSYNVSCDMLCNMLSDGLRRCLAAELASLTDAVLMKAGSLQDGVWPYVRVDNCRDEATMCGCCLLSLHAPRTADQGNVIKALQIIFSRKDAEDTTLLRAVKKLETLICDENNVLDSFEVNKAICLVKKLQKRNNMTEKEGRILQRHVTMFLGKYGSRVDYNNNENTISVVTSKLKDTLFLSLPHSEGERVKLNLQEILTLAMEEDDPEALTQLLKVICASLSTRREPALLSALCTLCVSLCRATASDVARRATLFCDTTPACHEMLTLISEEQSPGVRKMLYSYLPAVLSDELVESALSRARSMMGGHGTTKMASLDLIEALLPAIEDNHSIIKSELPLILDGLSKISQLDATATLEQAKKLFTEKQALFSSEEIVLLHNKLVANLIVGFVDRCSAKTYTRLTEICLKMATDLTDVIIDVSIVKMICNVTDKDFCKALFVLAVLKENFDFDSSINMVMNNYVLKELFGLVLCDSWMFELSAILVFMKEYACTLLELDYEKTTQFLASIMRTITPNQVIDQEKNLKNCLKTYKDILKYYPKILEDSFEFWLTNLPLPQIRDCCIEESQHTNMKALNIYLDATGFYLHSFMDKLTMWPKYVLRKYVEGVSGAEMSFLTDCLTAAVKVTGFDVKRILLEGKSSGDYVGVKFCAKFMKVFLDLLLRKPFVLLDEDLSNCCVILDDVVKFCTTRQCSDDISSQVLELVNELWPKYESKTNFHQKYQLLYNMTFLPKSLGRESNPMVWVASQLDDPTNRVNSTRLIAVLPGADEFSDCYTSFAAHNLGASLTSSPAATLRSLYDALAAKPSLALLKIAAALADTDEDIEDKWWEKAMDACCASLAQCDKFDACDTLLASTAGSLSLGVCNRLILPLLRYSTATYCERFFSRHHKALLNSLSQKPRDVRTADKYRQLIVDRTRALLILQVAFEKIPLSSLESPLSSLYEFNDPRPSTSNYLTWTTCKLCVTLRREECAFVEASACFRRYQCAIYSCLCAAICKSKPADKFYNLLFGREAWSKIEDPEASYDVPVFKRRRKTRRCVSIAVPSTGSTSGTGGTVSTAGTVSTTATPMFLRTLSEHPHKFDLYPKEVEQVEIQEIQLSDNPINRHCLAGTISALLTHTSSQPCWDAVCRQLADVDSWLVAQCICNCRAVLAPHASSLRPALLAFSAKTLQKGPMNGLHVDILETLTHWSGDPSLPESSLPHLQTTIEALITQAIEQRDPFIQVLDEFLTVYGQFVTVDWAVFENHFKNHTSRCLPIIKKIVKHKIQIPNLLQAFLQMDLKTWLDEYKMAECFGAALSCESERDSAIQSFRDMLKRVRQSESYVKLLFYAQSGCSEICDEVNFRQTTDQTRKLPKTLQNKCLHILSSYLSQRTIDYKTSMFETIELSELLTTDNVEALELVANGLLFMEDNFKRRVVKQSLKYCSHSMEKVRKAAFKVAAKAFEEIFRPTQSKEGEPASKRLKRSIDSLLDVINESDLYILNVVSKVAVGVTSYNDDVISVVRRVLKKNLGERLVECLALLVACEVKVVSACGPILQLFLAELRDDRRFLAAKLRDDPLEAIEPKRTSKHLTDTKTFRGTLLSYSGARRRAKTTGTPAAEKDVQVSLDSILEALLQFAKRHPHAGTSLLHQAASQLLGPGFDSRAFSLLTTALATPSDLTPVYIKLARLVLSDDERFEEAVLRLRDLSSGSDDADLVQCLCEELMMRKGIEMFEIRSSPMPCQDVTMEDNIFSLHDVTSCFGHLSNWDDLTVQQKAAKKIGLPTMWTEDERFKAALMDFNDSSLTGHWFSKLRSSFTGDTKDSSRWLDDARKWPRRKFTESAVAEALSWQLDEEPWTCEISPKDCLVEWSARLMIRASQANEREAIYPSRSNELLWCARANEMGLYRAVLQCCDRNNIENLTEEETLSWSYQKILSVAGMGLERNDSDLLREALDNAVALISKVSDSTSDSIGVYKQTFLLKQHFNELTTDSVTDILRKISKPMEKSSFYKSKKVLISLYEMAMIHYDKQWSDDTKVQDEVIRNIAFSLHRMRASNLGPNDRQVALLLNRLKGFSGSKINDEEVRNMILDLLDPQPPYFDDVTQQHTLAVLPVLGRRAGESSSSLRKLFAPVRDAGYCLLQYTELLAKSYDVEETWNATFTKIKDMMENPYAGTEYDLLVTQKNRLYAIADFDSTTKEKKLGVLRAVMATLTASPRSSLRISQLSPALLQSAVKGLLPRGEVVRIEDQVTVITNSVRRPCVITMLTSLGTRVRYMHKSGEPLALDAGVLRCGRRAGYQVIPTSADSGLIEYLEDHETLHSLISSVCDVDAISASIQRPFDDELILTPSPHTYKQLREKVPVNALRNAIERNSSSVEDFLTKKKNFQDTLATTAIFNWILGVGDRHLQNFLYSLRTGRLVSIDYGHSFTFVRELPVARLTACLLAVTDLQVLESRLQSELSQYRDSEYLFCNFLKMTFDWDKTIIEDKLPHIQALLSGRRLPHQVSRELIRSSHRKYKDAYLKLFDDVFKDFEDKDQYSVVEQISNLLALCTSSRILQVTRLGWMPWV